MVVQTLLTVLGSAILGILQGWEARGIADGAGACSFQGSEETENWRGVGSGYLLDGGLL